MSLFCYHRVRYNRHKGLPIFEHFNFDLIAGDSTDAPYATIASGIVGDEEPPNLESESHETTVPEVVEEPAVPEVVEEPAVPEVVEEPAVVEVVEEPGVPEVVEEPAVPEVDADSTEVASNIAEVVTDETNSSKDNDTTIEFDTFQIEGDNEMDNITWAALNETEISIADNSETRTLSLDEDDSFCTGNGKSTKRLLQARFYYEL